MRYLLVSLDQKKKIIQHYIKYQNRYLAIAIKEKRVKRSYNLNERKQKRELREVLSVKLKEGKQGE